MKLAVANLKKSTSATVSLFIFILIASILLNTGLMVITQINPFFDKKVEQLSDPHALLIIDQATYDKKMDEYIGNYLGVNQHEIENALYLSIAKFQYSDTELSSSAVIYNADLHRNIAQLKLIDQLETTGLNDIYIPFSFKLNSGYQVGDAFTIWFQDKKFTYRIAGFFETTMMGSTNMGTLKFFLPKVSYEALSAELSNEAEEVIISTVMDKQADAPQFIKDFKLRFPPIISDEANRYLLEFDIDLVKSISSLTINFLSVILVTFASIIVLISLIVIKYRVTNNIEDGITNIGVLKAIGYTNNQIIISIIIQFMFIALGAGLVGNILSYGLMPLIGNIISSLSGLVWQQDIKLAINMLSILLIVVLVILVTLFSAYRIRKLQPIIALRGGIFTHSFRKNHFPLEKTRAGLNFLLAIKSMGTSIKQYFMVLVIIMALTFASIFSMVLYYNIASDKTAFVNLFGAEPANVMIKVKQNEDIRELKYELEQMKQVRKVNLLDLLETSIDEQTVYMNVTDQYSDLENNVVYEGRQPLYDNEISMSWVVIEQINKEIGDYVTLQYGTGTAEYLVTGISQSIGNLGQIASVTVEGLQRLQSSYKGTILYVYLEEISNDEFIRKVLEQHGKYIAETIDIDKNVESQTKMYTSAVFAVMLVVLCITAVVVVMILYLVIKTMIIKRKKEFGVMKAVGYSTLQLMHQISVSFVPIIVAGVTIGGLLGYLYTNPMLSTLLSSAGVKSLQFIVPLSVVLLLCGAIVVVAYIVSMLVAVRIKRISVYSLITE